ncbi:nucleotidyltransferase family protein [Stygiolobus caldivivus]|uniref:Mannose-1-phosphate guanylyltransferase n=1 Tax=Stygiolobus caldivivus TaxID=2824673 RepID=A0A8D5ZIP5_9CREN|nr:NDP-sugar synthase [Stygiolobus caldivivus]BCU69452.1 mannose-1-phosphate guanylyltransferase [Stygiolobus caldivivus]
MVSAIVLAGGYATRLRPLSLTKPKALLPILDKPLIDYILDALEYSQVDNIYLSLRVMADKILEHIKNTNRNVIPVVESERLGDAGPLRIINNQYNLSDDVIVVYGDIYNEVDYKRLIEFHQSEGCDATVVGTQVEDPKRYGVLVVDDHKLIQIIEKPKVPVGNLINAGVYIFKRKLFEKIDGLANGNAVSISRDFLPKLISSGTCISVYPYKGLWMDIGIPSDYMRINLELLTLKYPKGFIGENANVSEKAELRPPFYISNGVTVGGDSFIRSSIVGRRSKIGKGSYIEESIFMENVQIGDFSSIVDSIIGENSTVGKWNRVESSILGDEVTTYNNIMINKDTIILPYKEVTESIHERGKIIL